MLCGEDEWQLNAVETACEMMWCVRQLRSRRTREQGFQRRASLTTIALETIRIARQLVDQATVDRLSVEKESLLYLPGRGCSSLSNALKVTYQKVIAQGVVPSISGEVMSSL